MYMYMSMQDDGVVAGEEKEDKDIGDLDDLLRREREMEKKRKESAPTDAEVCQIICRSAMHGRVYLFWGGVGGGLSITPLEFIPP